LEEERGERGGGKGGKEGEGGRIRGGFSTTSQLLLAVIVIIMQRPNATVHLEQKRRERGRCGTGHTKGASRTEMVVEMACKGGSA